MTHIFRGKCEFKSCPCPYYWRHDSDANKQRCHWCGHGECWHERRKCSFTSLRRAARRPQYSSEKALTVFVPKATPVAPLVPPLPIYGYCDNVVALPV